MSRGSYGRAPVARGRIPRDLAAGPEQVGSLRCVGGGGVSVAVDSWAAASPGNPRQRLEHLREVLAAKRPLFPLPRHYFARTRLERTLASLDLVLEPQRWREDGTLRPDAAGLVGMNELRQVTAHRVWGDDSLRDASWDIAVEPILVTRALAYQRFDEVRASVNTGAQAKFALWRAERHLRTGDGEEQAMHSTLSYISAWHALVGLHPCC
jgi:hypothetical protein